MHPIARSGAILASADRQLWLLRDVESDFCGEIGEDQIDDLLGALELFRIIGVKDPDDLREGFEPNVV